MADKDDGRNPLDVGNRTMQGKEASYLGSLPWDAMTRLIRFDGEALYRGRARMRTVSFEREIDPEDLG